MALLFGTPFFIYFGALSDRIGRKKIMMLGMFVAAISYFPIYNAMDKTVDLSSKQEVSAMYRVEGSVTPDEDGKMTEHSAKVRTYSDSTVVRDVTVTKAGKTTQHKEIKVGNASMVWLIFLVFIQVIFVTMVYGPIAAFLVELFPTRIRYTSMSLPYHIGNGVFGGLLPAIATMMVSRTGNHLAGLFYPVSIAIICMVIGMVFIKEKKTKDGYAEESEV